MGARQTRDADGLTDLERRFALEYLVDFNATAAYIRASVRKPTKRTAEANGYKLLRRKAIREFVGAERDRLMGNAELSVEQTLEKLRAFLMSDIRKLYDKNGFMLPMSKWPDDVAGAVVSVKESQWGREIKLVDKASTLEKAMKYHGLFVADNRQRTDPVTELLSHIYNTGSRVVPKQG